MASFNITYLPLAQLAPSGQYNTLRIFHGKEMAHAYIQLACGDCADGKPVLISAGLWPSDYCTQEDGNGTRAQEEDRNSFSIFSDFSTAICLLGVNSNIVSDKYTISQEQDSAYIDYMGYFYVEPMVKSSNYLEDFVTKSFDITKENAVKVLDRVTHLAHKCDADYKYTAVGGNTCLDFAQEIYELAGFTGDHYQLMHPEGSEWSQMYVYKLYTEYSTLLGDLLHDKVDLLIADY